LVTQAQQVLGQQESTRGTEDRNTVYGTWYYEQEAGAADLLQLRGYQRHRSMRQMARRGLADVPILDMPRGLVVRVVTPEHMRPIWDAYLEASADDLGAVSGTQEGFAAWASMPKWDTSLWRIAWDGDQVAGLVLSCVSTSDGSERYGYIEQVAVRRPWRGRGLAGALLAQTLRSLHDGGVHRVVLDVHEQNPSDAASLYSRLGFRVERRLHVVRKAL
jgi:mycothiol synthase